MRAQRQAEQLELHRSVALAEASRQEANIEMLETVLSRFEKVHTGSSDALVEIAKGVQENAKALNRWFALFEAHQGEGSTHTVRLEDEHEAHEKREREKLAALFPELAPNGDNSAAQQFIENMFTAKDHG